MWRKERSYGRSRSSSIIRIQTLLSCQAKFENHVISVNCVFMKMFICIWYQYLVSHHRLRKILGFYWRFLQVQMQSYVFILFCLKVCQSFVWAECCVCVLNMCMCIHLFFVNLSFNFFVHQNLFICWIYIILC